MKLVSKLFLIGVLPLIFFSCALINKAKTPFISHGKEDRKIIIGEAQPLLQDNEELNKKIQ